MVSISKVTLMLLGAIGVEGKQRQPHERTLKDQYHEPVVQKVHERKTRAHPEVEGGSCTALCLFEDDNNSWCLEGTSPMMVMGWEWYQNVDTSYWNVQFQPYLESQLSLTSNFVVERLVSSTFIIEMEKFLTKTYYSFLFDNTGQVCFGFGLSSDDINLEMTYQF